jgi:hypothetical protein
VKWFNHKNKHILKLKEYNRLKFLAMNLNRNTFSLDTRRIGGKKRTTRTFNLLIFDTTTIIPTMEVKCTTE